MLKIAIPSDSSQSIGGGWSFRNNLVKGLIGMADVVNNPLLADVVLITSATMITRDTFAMIKQANKKIVLRVDNIPRNSRNRNTGTSRLKDFADGADMVVYQSTWAKDLLGSFLNKENVIIHNGIDTEIFKPEGERYNFGGTPFNYMYSRYNRDEIKNWEVAWYEYQKIHAQEPQSKLILVGNFSDDLINYNFDFFRGEKYQYLGIIENQGEMAMAMRGCQYFMATYYNDCFSNTYLEYLCCGGELYKPNRSGGTGEMISLFLKKDLNYFSLKRMAWDYMDIFEEVIQHG
jgi:glycosyltransferase involved in cell wall biosynthesis